MPGDRPCDNHDLSGAAPQEHPGTFFRPGGDPARSATPEAPARCPSALAIESLTGEHGGMSRARDGNDRRVEWVTCDGPGAAGS